VRALRDIGIQPDILLCRAEKPLEADLKRKIALFCNVEVGAVIDAVDVASIYEVPLRFHADGLDDLALQKLRMEARPADLAPLTRFVSRVTKPSREVTIAVCGKYTGLKDAYKSIVEAFVHAGAENDARVQLAWVDAEEIERRGSADELLGGCHGILVPGGFGVRGIEGKVAAAGFARRMGVPYLGICLGMECAVIEFARNACGLDRANSAEFDAATPHPVIDLMPEQKQVINMGGTMRLGAYECRLAEGSRARAAYGEATVRERHRHRYEYNNEYRERLESKGLSASGVNPKTGLVEIVELPDHPWFVACQFHPEFLSRPGKAHPLFREFVRAAAQKGR
jgi:CTP synthase